MAGRRSEKDEHYIYIYIYRESPYAMSSDSQAEILTKMEHY